MSLDRCITNLREAGLLDDERAQYFAEIFEDLRTQYRTTMSEAAADAAATRETVTAAERLIMQSRRQKLMQVKVQEGIVSRVQEGLQAGVPAWKTVLAHFATREGLRGISSVESRHLAVMGQAHAKMNSLLQTFTKDLAGRVRKPALLMDVTREAFGQDTGNLAARELATAWRESAEMLRQRFNAAGGHIGKLDNWGLPQIHMADKVRAVSYEAWRDFIVPLLDLTRTVDGQTGRRFTPAQLDRALRNAYDSIRSEGMDDISLGNRRNPRLANRRAEHRFLHFKDGDAWISYQQRFGVDNPWDAMMGHVDAMSREIAQLEILGPAPGQTVKWLGDLLEQEVRTSKAAGKLFDRLVNNVRGAQLAMTETMRTFNGEVNRPVNASLARGFSTVRAVQTAAKLGGAAITALSDIAFGFATAKMNGLSTARIMRNQLRLLNPLDNADREFAVASGLIAEEAASRMGALWKYDDMVNTPEVARRIASAVIRASGLSAWTQAGKWAFGMEFMHALARVAGQAWDALEPAQRKGLQRYGWDAASWDQLRATPLHEHRGARFLRPEEVADDALRNRLLETILGEERFAVPQLVLGARALTQGSFQAGTWRGEIGRSIFQFKAFPVSVMMTHMARIVQEKNPVAAAGMVANLAISTTMLGALVIQLKQIAAGKDPRDMKDGRFWGNAMIQGGGAGLLGDFLYADTNRYGGSIWQTLAGPTLGTGIDVLDVTVGNLKQAAAGEKTNAGREAVRFLKANTPGSSLWYSRLAMERIFWDQLQQELDPEAHKAFRRAEQKARKDYDQNYWWEPGEAAPDDLPDLEAIDGGSR